MPISFADQTVIVTGAGAGLGRTHALAFAAAGANVVVNDIGGAGAANVAAEIEAAGGSAVADTTSVTDRAAVAAMIGRTLERFGRIDVLVNNAGILRDRSFHKMSDAEWDDVIAVHLDGAANMTRAVWPAMRERGYGRIVMTTSSSGLYGNFGQANYGAGKMAQVGMLTTLAIEGPKAGIRVNAVAPVAWTVMTDNLFPPGAKELMPPEAVSPGVLFLASEDAPNGAILNIGGGVYSLSRIVETVPVALGLAHTPDDVAAAYDRIADLSGAVPFDNGPARTIRLFQAAMAAAQSSN